MIFHFSKTYFALALLLVAPAVGAQELNGTYVRYCNVGRSGSLLNGSLSVAYGEAAGSAVCDIYAQGGFVEGYNITGTRGASSVSVSVSGETSSDVTSVVATVAGRTINWASTAATAGLAITQELSYATTDRSVRIRVTLRNTGATAITNLYYARQSDPDQAICTSSSDFTTANDVVRQGPGTGGSLITATAAGVSVGIGSFDSRARASQVSGGGSSDWATPSDPGGVSTDARVALIFREPSLAAAPAVPVPAARPASARDLGPDRVAAVPPLAAAPATERTPSPPPVAVRAGAARAVAAPAYVPLAFKAVDPDQITWQVVQLRAMVAALHDLDPETLSHQSVDEALATVPGLTPGDRATLHADAVLDLASATAAIERRLSDAETAFERDRRGARGARGPAL